MAQLTVAAAQALWQPETVYLNTASYGLPPRPAWDALQSALADWHGGRTTWEPWGDSTEASRAAFARMVGVGAGCVATGPTVSNLAGLIAASVKDGTRVLATERDFTSIFFPFMVQAARGVTVDFAPVARLPEAIDARADVVAFSAVQSSDGEVADLDAIATAATEHDALTVVDGSQACGWLPIDASRFDFVIAAAYKWMMSPRGTAFMTVRPDRLDGVVPHAAGWYAGEDPHTSYYGPPLRLARDARRLDVSPAWFSWVGTQPALELINDVGVAAINEHDLRLANRFREGLGLPPGNSAIVAVEVPDAERKLDGAGVMAAARAGRLRTSWHVYNTDADVDRVLELLRA